MTEGCSLVFSGCPSGSTMLTLKWCFQPRLVFGVRLKGNGVSSKFLVQEKGSEGLEPKLIPMGSGWNGPEKTDGMSSQAWQSMI